jgi:hypothetical protein
MKETEVRERIEVFLKRTVRKAVIPASLGVGLALAGCERTSAVGVYSAPMREDAALSSRDSADAAFDRLGIVETKYMGPFALDTNDDHPANADAADARIIRDGSLVPEYAGPFPLDTNVDRYTTTDAADARMILDGPVPEYAGPMKLDTREYRPDVPVYAAPMPDAADALDAEKD